MKYHFNTIQFLKFQLNKKMLTNFIQNKYKIEIDPSSMFDVHARRIDDNKRQILTILHVITLYNRLKKNPEKAVPARTVIMAGKVRLVNVHRSAFLFPYKLHFLALL